MERNPWMNTLIETNQKQFVIMPSYHGMKIHHYKSRCPLFATTNQIHWSSVTDSGPVADYSSTVSATQLKKKQCRLQQHRIGNAA